MKRQREIHRRRPADRRASHPVDESPISADDDETNAIPSSAVSSISASTAKSCGKDDRAFITPCRKLLFLALGLDFTNENNSSSSDAVVTIVIPGCWDYLTMHEFATLRCLSKDIRRQLQTMDYKHCGDGNDYILAYPGIPGVLTGGGGLFPHQLASLQAMQAAEQRSRKYGDLRGGILGDAPGL
jgi:hypothetical protein